MRGWSLAAGLILAASPLAAQAGNCTLGNLPDSTNEAEIFRIRGASTAFARNATPAMLRPHAMYLQLEVASLTHIDAETATPHYCNAGKPPENVNILPFFPRPRLLIGLADEFTFEVSWVPPVRINGVKADLLGAALTRTVPVGRGLVSIRGNATLGEIRAPITCTKEQVAVDTLADPSSQCAGGAGPSDDHFKPNSYGVDLTYGWPVGRGTLRPYAGAGMNWLRSRFQVDFTDRHGTLIDQKIEGNYRRLVVFAGMSWFPVARWGLNAELYADPGTTVVGRVGVTYGVK